jgi:Endonuclease I
MGELHTVGEPDLRLTDDLASITSANANMGRLTTLIEWHLLDPVDDAERQRNDLIFQIYQANRNPFVDRPEWVLAVFGDPRRLTLTLASGALKLRWPAGLRRAVLTASNDLEAWANVSPGVVTIEGEERVATLPANLPRIFFRLALQ